MATVALTTANQIDVVEWGEQETLIANVAIVAGTFVIATTTGRWIQALATSAGAVAGARLALKTVIAGEALTAMKSGVVGGYTVTQAFDAPLYISDTGTLADSVGTVTVLVGRVIAGTANQVTAAHDKNVRIDCPL